MKDRFDFTRNRIAPGSAEVFLEDGVVWRGGDVPGRWRTPEPSSAVPSAIAVGGGRILGIGSQDDLAPLRGPATRRVSLEGGFVGPGFVDAHVHLLAGGMHLSRVQLRGAGSPEALTRRVAERAATVPPGSWILGGGWNEGDWGGGLPARGWLDRAAPDHPVFLHRSDLHMGVASSRALKLGGIPEERAGPEEEGVDRDPATGRPTGILREGAILRITRVVPPPSREALRAAARRAVGHALSRGVTQLHDMGSLEGRTGSWESLEILRELRAAGELPLRVVAALPLEDWPEVAAFVAELGRGDARLRWGVVKGFVDGSLGSATAWFHAPYADDRGNRGGPVAELDRLDRDLRSAVASGLQPAVHAIGDRANDWLLALFARIERDLPGPDLRLRVEHAQHLTPEAVRRAGGGKTIFSVQPLHLTDDGRWAARRLGPERSGGAYPLGSLERAGARLAFGSDWTVAAMDPIAAVRAATTRRLDGSGEVWGPEERMGLDGALRAHTLGGAIAGCMERETGSLAVGKRADLVVLTKNPFALSPETLTEEVEVERTFVDGIEVHRADVHPVAPGA